MDAESQADSLPPNRARGRDAALHPEPLRLPAARRCAADGLRNLRRSLSRWLIQHGVLRDEVEDVIQDALVRLCRTEREQSIRNPAAFLKTAVKRIRIDRWRSAERDRRLFVAESAEALQIVDPAPQPSDEAETDQRLERLGWKLDVLSPRTREVFTLHRLEGRTYPEIAAALGMSVSAVEKHIARAALALATESADDD